MSELFKPRDAARRLAVSERQLWAYTHPRGPIPVIRIGKAVRYSPAALDEYVQSQIKNQAASTAGEA